MVKIMENPIKMDDLGGTTLFGNIQLVVWHSFGANETGNHLIPGGSIRDQDSSSIVGGHRKTIWKG